MKHQAINTGVMAAKSHLRRAVGPCMTLEVLDKS